MSFLYPFTYHATYRGAGPGHAVSNSIPISTLSPYIYTVISWSKHKGTATGRAAGCGSGERPDARVPRRHLSPPDGCCAPVGVTAAEKGDAAPIPWSCRVPVLPGGLGGAAVVHRRLDGTKLARLCAAEDLEQVLLDGDADGLEWQVVHLRREGVLDLDRDGVDLEHDERDKGANDDRPPLVISGDRERVREEPEEHEDALLREVAKRHRSLLDALASAERVDERLDVVANHNLPPLVHLGGGALCTHRLVKLVPHARLHLVDHHHREVVVRLALLEERLLVLARLEVQRRPPPERHHVWSHHRREHLFRGELGDLVRGWPHATQRRLCAPRKADRRLDDAPLPLEVGHENGSVGGDVAR
mmetsp:Transcript_22985/g.68126  ORF Transcript_22985/g.68126 Transcript_22985/m.68126 type:complete len:360 (+) Transcript_22985:714-1793(+)